MGSARLLPQAVNQTCRRSPMTGKMRLTAHEEKMGSPKPQGHSVPPMSTTQAHGYPSSPSTTWFGLGPSPSVGERPQISLGPSRLRSPHRLRRDHFLHSHDPAAIYSTLRHSPALSTAGVRCWSCVGDLRTMRHSPPRVALGFEYDGGRSPFCSTRAFAACHAQKKKFFILLEMDKRKGFEEKGKK
ncbi:hypothetical protein BKA81DRAFT_75348 [Phyllosticta paracitricarpa]